MEEGYGRTDEGGGVRKEGPGRGMRDEMTDRMEEGRGRMYSTVHMREGV